MKGESPSRKLIEHKNEERLNKLINSNKRLAVKLGVSQKHKMYGDEYLKESLLKVKNA